MQRIVLVSHDPSDALDLATAWVATDPTHVVLFDGAAAAARRNHPDHAAVAAAAAAGVVVSVHDDAVLRRGMTAADLADGVKTVDLDEIADLIGDATGPVIWL